MATIYLSMGSNLGDRKGSLKSAVRCLAKHPRIELRSVSSLYETTPVGVGPQPDFLNAAVMVRTTLDPDELLQLLKGIQRNHGRVPESHNQPRTIDIDIILYDNLVSTDCDLTIPHPKLEERAFVLEPLIEISPDLINPTTGKSLEDSLKTLHGSQFVTRFEDGQWWE